jgi:hypothetical protein
MAKPYAFRHKHGRALHATQGPWLVEGPGGFSFELVDRTDAALLAKKLNDVSRAEADILTEKLSAPHPKRHHATKTSPAQLQGEIDAVLRASDRTKYGYDTDPISDREFEQAARLDSKKYGLKHEEALRFVKHPRYLSIRDDVERWREQHGFPATNSSLTRGYLLSKLRAL